MLECIPLLLTGLRAFLAPVVVLLALYAALPAAFAICLVAAFVSDVFDGVIARRLNLATAAIRRLDSAADTLFYAACAFAAWHLHPAAVAERAVPLSILLVLEVLRYILDFTKFRREASYHMWSSKLWGIGLFVGFFSLLVLGSRGAAISFAIYMGIVADLEGMAISLILPQWRADIPSFFHALSVRRRLGIQ